MVTLLQPLPAQPSQPTPPPKAAKIMRREKRRAPGVVTELDAVAVDKIMSFLSDQDLRAFHQVNHAWKSALESRTALNNSRLKLVQEIRMNKENLGIRLKERLPNNATQVNRNHVVVGIKPENVLLKECSNLMVSARDSPSSPANILSTDANENVTHISRFVFQETQAENFWKRGQKLFQFRSPLDCLENSSESKCETARRKGKNNKNLGVKNTKKLLRRLLL